MIISLLVSPLLFEVPIADFSCAVVWMAAILLIIESLFQVFVDCYKGSKYDYYHSPLYVPQHFFSSLATSRCLFSFLFFH